MTLTRLFRVILRAAAIAAAVAVTITTTHGGTSIHISDNYRVIKRVRTTSTQIYYVVHGC